MVRIWGKRKARHGELQGTPGKPRLEENMGRRVWYQGPFLHGQHEEKVGVGLVFMGLGRCHPCVSMEMHS